MEPLEGAEAYAIDRTVVLDHDLYPQRRNWRFCHELAHILLEHTRSETITPEMEREAEELAGELMLPAGDFRSLMTGLELPRLKERYPHASWEAVARRWAEFRPALLTIFDNHKLVRRVAPQGFAFPTRPTEAELEVVRLCYRERCHHSARSEGLKMQALFVDEGRSVERVLLLTEFPEEG